MALVLPQDFWTWCLCTWNTCSTSLHGSLIYCFSFLFRSLARSSWGIQFNKKPLYPTLMPFSVLFLFQAHFTLCHANNLLFQNYSAHLLSLEYEHHVHRDFDLHQIVSVCTWLVMADFLSHVFIHLLLSYPLPGWLSWWFLVRPTKWIFLCIYDVLSGFSEAEISGFHSEACLCAKVKGSQWRQIQRLELAF